jgi:hypothetical protein
MEKTYYKVVVRDGDGLYSAWIKDQKLNRCVKKYAVGKQTKGRGTKLFIFDSFENARSWGIAQLCSREIYECKATGVENAPKHIPMINDLVKIEGSIMFWNLIHRWWKERTQKSLKGELRSKGFQTVPDGTLVANSVTLLRKVL